MNILRPRTLIPLQSAAALLLLLLIPLPLRAQNPPWGTNYGEFIKNKSSSIMAEFKPVEKPKYKHKILKFITGINPEIINQIKVVRIRSNPIREFMFINNGLYTIKENWNIIPVKDEKKVYSDLKRQYGKPDIKDDGNLRTISFKKGRTKVIYYRLLYGNGTARCAVYYYSTRMFRMLFMGK
jgi:hypothetical protein